MCLRRGKPNLPILVVWADVVVNAGTHEDRGPCYALLMSRRARTERREAERDARKLARARMKLAALEPGGAPDRPIDVTSASVIEVHAKSTPCAACGHDGVRVEEHEAKEGLRVVRVLCPRCGTRRDVFYRIASPLS